MNEPFRSALGIIETLQQRGYEAYFVGGAVRDHLLNRPIGDVDIATSARPDEVMAVFPKTVPVGLKHGTVVVLYEGVPYEVTTFRTEGTYEDYRRPESVTFVRSLRQDLERRDFTMNAIAMDGSGRLIDPFGGKEAIQQRVIRTVGEAKARFSEDALRMMRAIRFASQLGFALDPDTKRAIGEHAPLLAHISVERMTVEFEKLMAGPFAAEAFSLLAETGLFAYLPGLSDKQDELWELARYDWTKLASSEERWSMLCRSLSLAEDAPAFLRRWKLPNRLIKSVQAALRFLSMIRSSDDWTRDKLYEAGRSTALASEAVRALISGEDVEERRRRLLARFAELPIQERSELAVTGTDIMKWFGRPGGPWLAEAMHHVERAVLGGLVENEKERIKEWLMRCNQTFEKNC